MTHSDTAVVTPSSDVESAYAWRRLAICLLIGTIGGVGMWSVVVALPSVQAEFGATRAEATLPYTLATIGFAFGGVLMGRLADRFGVAWPIMIAAIGLCLGYLGAAASTSLWQFTLAHAVLIGAFGASATFGPLMSDVSQWFSRNRGIAVSISAAGNYLAGTIWPPIVQHLINGYGWRAAHFGIGVFCVATMLPLALLLRRPVPAADANAGNSQVYDPRTALGISPGTLQWLICIAGVCCCVAMAMPQVHIVAYCGDLGYGVARGAEMLSLMLAFGIVSRVATGFIADRIGGVATLLLSAALQGVALMLYIGFDGLTSLYVISALFGLFQGGIVPSYAIIIREYFPPAEAGTRVGLAVMATLFGMAFGGWVSGMIFDLTGSYALAFANGLAFNLINVSIAAWLLLRTHRPTLAIA
ncbi:MAG TPA: MFS transporter [Pseudolabrys sp.]|nr:MFS transporter [Pseudolabrys sp.]